MTDDTRKGLTGGLRDMNEYLGQLVTVAAGSIVILATFSGSERAATDGVFASFAVGLFAYCILAAMLARIGLIFYSSMKPNDGSKSATETFTAWSLVTGLGAFGLGVIALAIYAVQVVHGV